MASEPNVPPPPHTGPFRRLREWDRSRFGRRPYALWSPLSVDEALDRLERHLTPIPTIDPGLDFPGTEFRGSVVGPQVKMTTHFGQGHNTFRWVFDGEVVKDDLGSKLVGELGPSEINRPFAALWITVVVVVVFVSLSVLIYNLVTGHGFGAALVVAVAAGSIWFFRQAVESSWRKAGAEWDLMQAWLYDLLQAFPLQPPA